MLMTGTGFWLQHRAVWEDPDVSEGSKVVLKMQIIFRAHLI
jgi:hypothetical protein